MLSPHGTVVRTQFNHISHVQAQKLALGRASRTLVVLGGMMEGGKGGRSDFLWGAVDRKVAGGRRGTGGGEGGERAGQGEKPQQGGAVGKSELKRMLRGYSPKPSTHSLELPTPGGKRSAGQMRTGIQLPRS